MTAVGEVVLRRMEEEEDLSLLLEKDCTLLPPPLDSVAAVCSSEHTSHSTHTHTHTSHQLQ